MKVEVLKVLNQVIFGKSKLQFPQGHSYRLGFAANTPHLRVPAFREQVRDFYKEVSPVCLFCKLPAEVPLTTVSFRIYLQLSLGHFGEKIKKELIAIHNYNSVWQCLWVNGAHISKLPLLSFSHQPLLPSSCKWKVPIALHSRQRQLPAGL